MSSQIGEYGKKNGEKELRLLVSLLPPSRLVQELGKNVVRR